MMLTSQFLKKREARGPVTETALTVDVPGIADGHQTASSSLLGMGPRFDRGPPDKPLG
jgi:hypothetical protein